MPEAVPDSNATPVGHQILGCSPLAYWALGYTCQKEAMHVILAVACEDMRAYAHVAASSPSNRIISSYFACTIGHSDPCLAAMHQDAVPVTATYQLPHHVHTTQAGLASHAPQHPAGVGAPPAKVKLYSPLSMASKKATYFVSCDAEQLGSTESREAQKHCNCNMSSREAQKSAWHLAARRHGTSAWQPRCSPGTFPEKLPSRSIQDLGVDC
jgi:hypothetical protein